MLAANMKKTGSSDQRGAVMVEAAIYFPITIAIVMVVIYFGLFKMQESYFFFQVERAALEIARETAYPGYDSFTPETPMTNTRVDFGWEEGPSENQVKQYFASYKGTASNIYRWGVDGKAKKRISDYQEALRKNSAMFSLGRTEAYVGVENSLLSKAVRAELKYVIPMPGIIKLLGVTEDVTIYSAAYQPIMNTTDFVRNVDFAWDMGNFLLEKFDKDGKTQKIGEAFDQVSNLLF